jgi:hypothetical protein
MQFDHVIRVNEDGTIESVPNIWAPEINIYGDIDGQVDSDSEADMVADVAGQGWQLLTGFTGQYSYSGSIMHPSEFIGGGLEDFILETPGYYAAVVVDLQPYDHDSSEESENVGWAVAYREEI